MQPVTIAATGGLGNQLFQFAAALRIAEASGRGVRICCRGYDRPLARRAFVAVRRAVRGLWADADGRFRLDAMVRGPVILRMQRFAGETDAREDRSRGLDRASLKRAFRDPGATIPGSAILRTAEQVLAVVERPSAIAPDEIPLVAGFMQDDRLVAPVLDRMRSLLAAPARSGYLDRWLPVARHGRTVGVHVRRGDYLKPAFRDLLPVIPASWYARAGAMLRERHGDVSFLVVTDEPAWARSELRMPGPMEIASAEHPSSPQEDLELLRACRHHVIPNSTFGWWGARLSESGGSVVAPQRWAIGAPTDPALLPAQWTRLANDEDGR